MQYGVLRRMFKLLVIDDEAGIRFSIQQIFRSPTVTVFAAENGPDGLALISGESPDVVLLDIHLGNQSGLSLLDEIREIDPKCLVVLITGRGTADTAIDAMKRGAFDYLVKPLDMNQLKQVVEQAFRISRLMHVPATVDTTSADGDTSERIIGSGSAMQSIGKQIGRIARQDINVLILGESGTGKELVARAIYHHSHRNQSPFLVINCAAIPETLLESELFGHERGAFTGAERRRVGKFEQCHGGTLFLDEVGDMPVATQAKILRLLQEKQFERVGGNETLTVDVHIIAATNQNLDAMIEAGRFRRDLYYRLRGMTIHLPPLRDRTEDIPELAHYFLFRFNRQLGTSVQSISPEALELMQNYSWPGNIRELQNVLRESLVGSTGPTLLAEFLPSELHRELADEPAAMDPDVFRELDWDLLGRFVSNALKQKHKDTYRRALLLFDRLVVGHAMQCTEGHQARAAEILGLSRPTIRAKIRAIEAEQVRADA
jgi:two-component system nitrogen regulation response regulator GlnG